MSAYCVLLWGLWEKCKAWGCVRGQPSFWSPQSSPKGPYLSPTLANQSRTTTQALWPGASVPLPHSCPTPCELVLLFRVTAWQPCAKSFALPGPVYLLTATAGKNTHCLAWGGVGSRCLPSERAQTTWRSCSFPSPGRWNRDFCHHYSQECGDSNVAASLQLDENPSWMPLSLKSEPQFSSPHIL